MPAARAPTEEIFSPQVLSRCQWGDTTTNTASAAVPSNGQQPARTAQAASAPGTACSYSYPHPSPPSSNVSAPHKPRPPAGSDSTKSSQNNSKIWCTVTTEQREQIKEFWLSLEKDELRDLVKIEKNTILKQMKEQQKHSCSCAVCRHKRHVFEEELELLYDAYYEELEEYANYQQRYVNSGGTIPPPPGPGPFPGSVEIDRNSVPIGHSYTNLRLPIHDYPGPSKTPDLTNGRKYSKNESEFDDGGDEEEYDESEGEEEEAKCHDRRNAGLCEYWMSGTKANGRDRIFTLDSNFTVTGPGDILAVADDLLKNDAQKLLEMVEHLAERRMQCEEEAARDEDDKDEEEFMSKEQRMEEGKRIFSTFAARMFEQRILQVYREKVAQERQQQLLRELEDEGKLSKEREAKKQTQSQQKKQQKLARGEERAAKGAEKVAEETVMKAKQQTTEEQMRKTQEEEKARHDTARKAAEEEQHNEENCRKRLAEEREREAERECSEQVEEIRSRLSGDLNIHITRDGEFPVAAGGCADIYKGTLRVPPTAMKVAIKVIKVYSAEDNHPKRTKRLRRELKVWMKLNHTNVLALFGTTSGFGPFPAMVCPWLENGTLTLYLERYCIDLEIQQILTLIHDTASGLKYLHSRSIVHGDLSGSNVLIDANGRACIADFGLSTVLDEIGGSTFATTSTGKPRGTLRWAAPELLDLVDYEDAKTQHTGPTTQSDIYSFGGIMLQILSGKVPYHYYSRDMQIIAAIFRGETPARPDSPHVTDRRWGFIQRCWSPFKAVAVQRPSSEDIVTFSTEELAGGNSP